jgi:hypothetical protein
MRDTNYELEVSPNLLRHVFLPRIVVHRLCGDAELLQRESVRLPVQ